MKYEHLMGTRESNINEFTLKVQQVVQAILNQIHCSPSPLIFSFLPLISISYFGILSLQRICHRATCLVSPEKIFCTPINIIVEFLSLQPVVFYLYLESFSTLRHWCHFIVFITSSKSLVEFITLPRQLSIPTLLYEIGKTQQLT